MISSETKDMRRSWCLINILFVLYLSATLKTAAVCAWVHVHQLLLSVGNITIRNRWRHIVLYHSNVLFFNLALFLRFTQWLYCFWVFLLICCGFFSLSASRIIQKLHFFHKILCKGLSWPNLQEIRFWHQRDKGQGHSNVKKNCNREVQQVSFCTRQHWLQIKFWAFNVKDQCYQKNQNSFCTYHWRWLTKRGLIGVTW